MIVNLIKSFKAFKNVMRIIILIGCIALIASFMVEKDSLRGLLAGFGTSLTLIAIVNLIMTYIKEKRNNDYDVEMTLQMKDERVKINKLKTFAYSGMIAILCLCIVVVARALVEFELLIGNVIVLFSYSISVTIFKIYYKNK